MLQKKLFKVIVLIIIITSIGLLSIINNYNSIESEEELINEYIDETTTLISSTTTSKNTSKKTTTTHKKSEYSMILEIPKINIKKGIYDKNNRLNNVDKNITLINSSSYPDEDKGSVILASHNGNTKVSYFKRLEELSIDDISYIYYKGIKYTYKIYKYEIVDKVGSINVSKDKNSSNLVLISCKNGTDDKQIVYVARLINKEYY